MTRSNIRIILIIESFLLVYYKLLIPHKLWNSNKSLWIKATSLYSDSLWRESNCLARAPGHRLVRVHLLHCMCVLLRNSCTQASRSNILHTHTPKAMTGRVEAKKLLPRRMQSDCSFILRQVPLILSNRCQLTSDVKTQFLWLNPIAWFYFTRLRICSKTQTA